MASLHLPSNPTLPFSRETRESASRSISPISRIIRDFSLIVDKWIRLVLLFRTGPNTILIHGRDTEISKVIKDVCRSFQKTNKDKRKHTVAG